MVVTIMNSIFSNINSFTHNILNNIILPGDYVIDATVGNGNDTLFLAQKVAEEGMVFGFDIQLKAIENTGSLLEKHGLLNRVTLIHDGHENMINYITRPVRAVMFNLGYLPQSDHRIKTLPDTTIEALGQAAQLLLPGGVISVMVYPGHPGGEKEKDRVDQFLKSLNSKDWDALQWSFLNRSAKAPYLCIVHKKGG